MTATRLAETQRARRLRVNGRRDKIARVLSILDERGELAIPGMKSAVARYYGVSRQYIGILVRELGLSG